MSKIALNGNALGSGTFTLASPNSNSDRTLTLPDSAGTLTTSEAVTAAGYTTPAAVLTQFNATGTAPVYACRAWVNFDGTGTVAIRASGNVSSITDLGTGTYRVNLTTALPDANYAVVIGFRQNDTVVGYQQSATTTTSTEVYSRASTATGTLTDAESISVTIFR